MEEYIVDITENSLRGECDPFCYPNDKRCDPGEADCLPDGCYPTED